MYTLGAYVVSDKFKQLFEEARNNGMDPGWVDRFEETFEASGLRKDNQTIKEENRLLRETASKLKTGLLQDRFKGMGITISPSILNIPDELDPSDPEKVQSWAEEMGLITKQETTPPAERQIHDRIAAASNEGNVTTAPSISDIQNLGEDEFWKVAQQREAAIKAGKLTP
jgi:hypothetical protein